MKQISQKIALDLIIWLPRCKKWLQLINNNSCISYEKMSQSRKKYAYNLTDSTYHESYSSMLLGSKTATHKMVYVGMQK